MVNLFNDIIPTNKQSQSYKFIRDDIGHQSARRILNEIFNSFKPIDKNFIQEFQSNGFDSRIWELYLAAVFQEQEFIIERLYDRPDFELVKKGRKIYVDNPIKKNKLHSVNNIACLRIFLISDLAINNK